MSTTTGRPWPPGGAPMEERWSGSWAATFRTSSYWPPACCRCGSTPKWESPWWRPTSIWNTPSTRWSGPSLKRSWTGPMTARSMPWPSPTAPMSSSVSICTCESCAGWSRKSRCRRWSLSIGCLPATVCTRSATSRPWSCSARRWSGGQAGPSPMKRSPPPEPIKRSGLPG